MPMRASDYPPEWPTLSKRIRMERAGGRCECSGECGRKHETPGEVGTGNAGRCRAHNGDECERGPGRVVLTVAHLCRPEDHDPPAKCGDEAHLKALCQGCHLRLDHPIHVRHARETRARRQGVQELPFPGFAAEGEGGLCPEGRGLDPSRGRCDSVPPLVCRVPTEAEAADLARTEPEYVRPVRRKPDA